MTKNNFQLNFKEKKVQYELFLLFQRFFFKIEEYKCEAGFFLQSNRQFLFTHLSEKRKPPFRRPQDLVLIYI